MRKLLRVIAAVQTWTAVVAAVASALAAGVVAAAGETQAAPVFLLPAIAAGGVAAGGGILWCLTVLTVPSVPPGRRAARAGLRILARVLLGAGLLLAGAAAVLASDEFLVRSRFGGVTPLVTLCAGLALAGLGGVLGCLVRLAYPDPRATVAPASHPPGPLVGGFALVMAFAVAAATALTAGGLAWAAASGSGSAVAAVGLVATVVLGLIWCAGVIARPPAAPPGRSRGWWLRVLAGVQVALGGGLAVAGAEHLWAHAGRMTWPPTERVLVGAGMCLMALGLSCVGGVLWCAVRVAYPGEPKA